MPTTNKVVVVNAKVDNSILTKVIKAIKQIVRSSKHMKLLQKVKLNTKQELA